MSYKVLIVDDSKLARMAVARALSALRPDWVRLEAGNADEGLAIIEKGGVDLAILDFNMPGRDGLALASEILAKHPDMPLAVVSANYQDEIVSRAAEAGAHFLPKPVTEKALDDFARHADATLKAGSR
jgi:DNA-binding NarL/FixJ family response regulator